MIGAFLYYRATGDPGWSPALAWLVAIAVPAAARRPDPPAGDGPPAPGVVAGPGRGDPAPCSSWPSPWPTRSGATRGRRCARRCRTPLETSSATGSTVGEDRLWLIVIAIVVTAVLAAVFRWTRFGHATDAAAENPIAAAALGYSPDRIAMVNWAAGRRARRRRRGAGRADPVPQRRRARLHVLRGLAAALVGLVPLVLVDARRCVRHRRRGVDAQPLHREQGGVRPVRRSDDGLLLGKFTSASVSRSVAFLVIVVVMVVGGRSLPLRSALLDRLARGRQRTVSMIGAGAAVGGAATVLSARRRTTGRCR